jgi:hypothetical protein
MHHQLQQHCRKPGSETNKNAGNNKELLFSESLVKPINPELDKSQHFRHESSGWLKRSGSCSGRPLPLWTKKQEQHPCRCKRKTQGDAGDH